MEENKKCFFGIHKYEIKQELNVIDHETDKDVIVGVNYICTCSNCGKVKTVFVPTDSRYLNFIR